MQNIHDEQEIKILNKDRIDHAVWSHIGAQGKRENGSTYIYVFICF